MKKWLFIIILLVIAAGILLAVFLPKSHKATAPSLVTVKRGDLTQTAIAAGNIVPKTTATIKAELSGVAQTLFVDAGQLVKQGEPLVKIQQNKTPEDVAKMMSEFATNKAKMEGDKQQLNSYALLLKHHVINENYGNYITAKSTYQADLSAYQLSQQQLELYQNGEATLKDPLTGKPIKDSVTGEIKKITNIVKSPVSGFILQRMVNQGDAINASGGNQPGTALFTIADMNNKNLIFRGAVDESNATHIKPGQTAVITLAALPDAKITGKITSVALQSDEQNIKPSNTSTEPSSQQDNSNSHFNVGFQVEIGDLSIPSQVNLLSGYSANATLTLQTEKNVLLIPESAISLNGNQPIVNLYEGKDKPSKPVPVTLGLSDGSQVVVTKGLSEGDQILDGSSTTAGTP
jgi:HlyD family secretion protein